MEKTQSDNGAKGRRSTAFIALCSFVIVSLCRFSSAQIRVPDPDRILTPEQSFSSAAGKGLAGADAAFAWNAASALRNPALLYSCRNSDAPRSRSFYAGCGRDSLFNRLVLPFGASWSRRKNAVAVHGRILSSSFGLQNYEAAATLCRRVLAKAHPQGPLDIGLNARYSYADWSGRVVDTLSAVRSWFGSGGQRVRPDSVMVLDPRRMIREHRVFLDIGAFKPEIGEHVDCGLSVTNLLGYRWTAENADTVRSMDSSKTAVDTVTAVKRYGGRWRDTAAALALRYAVVNFSCNFKIANSGPSMFLSFPFQVEGFGLFDNSMKKVWTLRIAAQAHFRKNFFLRLGYAYAPGLISGDPAAAALAISKVNNLTLGASILLPRLPCCVDCYMTNNEWGMTIAFDY